MFLEVKSKKAKGRKGRKNEKRSQSVFVLRTTPRQVYHKYVGNTKLVKRSQIL